MVDPSLSIHDSDPNPSGWRDGNEHVDEGQGELGLLVWALGLAKASGKRLVLQKNHLSSTHVQCDLGKHVIMEGALRRAQESACDVEDTAGWLVTLGDNVVVGMVGAID